VRVAPGRSIGGWLPERDPRRQPPILIVGFDSNGKQMRSLALDERRVEARIDERICAHEPVQERHIRIHSGDLALRERAAHA
jgi:hypothetical protein